MEKQQSEYSLALEYLLKTYHDLVFTLHYYINTSSASSRRIKELAHLWKHPRGISNLIKTIALQLNHSEVQMKGCTLATEAKTRHQQSLIPIAFEVKNPLFQPDSIIVKKEESLGSEGEEQSFQKDELDEEFESHPSCPESRSYKRGPYKSYSMAEKERAVKLLLDDQVSITEISRLLKIPCKNIKRWSTQGVFRKRGGGRRRSSPIMEEKVCRWIREEFAIGEEIEIDRIQEYALSICGDCSFKASRGWVLKFIDRFKLRGMFVFR